MSDKKNKYKNQALIVLILALLPVLLVGTTNYVVDPLQVYRKQKLVQPRFWREQRSQNAGKIRRYLPCDGYDSIIVGNSVAGNFMPIRTVEVLGWRKAMNLTVNGGFPAEQAFTLQEALRRSRLDHVLWVIRPGNFCGEKTEEWHPARTMPKYLYTDTIFDDAPYLLNWDILQFSLGLLQGEGLTKAWKNDLDSLNYWQSRKLIRSQIKYNSPRNLARLRAKKPRQGCGFNIDPGAEYPLADRYLLKIVQENPKVEFMVLVAPEARQHIASNQPSFLGRYYGVQHYLVQKAEQLPNLKVFAFDNDDSIVGNLANYRDHFHYHSGVNEVMLKAMAQGRNRLTAANAEAYFKTVTKRICTYELLSDFASMIPFAKDKENAYFKKLMDRKKRRAKNPAQRRSALPNVVVNSVC